MDPKTEMTSFDLRAAAHELQSLEGSKLNKAYQRRDEIALNLWKPGEGRQDLQATVGRCAYQTEYRRENPRDPPDFAMQMRKHLGGGTLVDIHQMGFDRILVLEFDTHKGARSLILELFSDGNALVTDPSGILAAMRFQDFSSRTLRPGVSYEPPPMRGDPLTLSPDEVEEILAGSDRDLVRCLAVELDLSGYADEVVHRAGLDKSTPAPDADPDAVWDVLDPLLSTFRDHDYEPHVYYDDETGVDVAPIQLEHLVDDGLDAEPFPTVNEALDEYYSQELPKHHRTEAQQAKQAKIDKLETRIEHQRDGIDRLQQEAEDARATAEAIYQNYQVCQDVLDALDGLTGDALRDTVEAGDVPHADRIRDVRADEEVVTVEIEDADGDTFEADLRLGVGVEENASWHYDRADHREAKAERAEEALQESLEKKRQVEAEEVEIGELQERDVERKFWFEDYRWCIASTGNVIVGGRDASSNDRVVKKYLESKDRYAHANVSGAPSIVVKAIDGDVPPEAALEEAVHFGVAYSNAWSQGWAEAEGYWVLPEQVSKSPESGEHLATGAFVIRGTRNHMTCPVEAAVGIVEVQGVPKVMGGPPACLEARSDEYVRVEPGTIDKNEAAGQIADALEVDVEDVQQALPPGPCRIAETVGVQL